MIVDSFYIPDVTPATTMHFDGRQTGYIFGGNRFHARCHHRIPAVLAATSEANSVVMMDTMPVRPSGMPVSLGANGTLLPDTG